MLRWVRDLYVHTPIWSMETEQRTCSTCAQMYPVSDFPSKPVESQCTHEQDTCSQCWRHWLQVQVATKTFDRIQCAQCSTLLGQGEVKAFATQEIYQSYLDSEVRAALSSDPNFYWCMSASCSHGQLHYDGDIFTCQACGHKTCMACTAPWHAGETCKDHQARMLEEQEEAEISIQTGRQAGVEVSDEKKELRKRRRMEEEAAAKTLSKVSKLCPGCTRKVQKHGGCDHIHCTQCGADFCYVCLADFSRIWSEGNSAHDGTCRYWRAAPR